ncbi:hypothetical protein MMPV_002908, partial [Pyropia vietnamensis]
MDEAVAVAVAEAGEEDVIKAARGRLVAAAIGPSPAGDPWTFCSTDTAGGDEARVGSLLEAFREDLLAGARATAAAGRPPAIRCAEHVLVCFMSCQDRGPGMEPRREAARILVPALMQLLLQSLGGLLWLAPALGVVGSPIPPTGTPGELAASATAPAATAAAAISVSARSVARRVAEGDAGAVEVAAVAPPSVVSPPSSSSKSGDEAARPSGGDDGGLGGGDGGGSGGATSLAAPLSPFRVARATPGRRHSTSMAGKLGTIAAKCGVLLGTHSAGLIEALSLRRGASVVELATGAAPIQHCANEAALL